MGKKRLFVIFMCFSFILLFSVVTIYADDSDNGDGEGTSNLQLETEILNNKKEDVNSNTTIDDVNLFSNDYGKKINEEESANAKYYDNVSKGIFSNENIVNQDSGNDVKLFEDKVTFDKSISETTESSNYIIVFISILLILMILTYVLTRKKYRNRSKEKSKNENYSYLYE